MTTTNARGLGGVFQSKHIRKQIELNKLFAADDRFEQKAKACVYWLKDRSHKRQDP